MTDKQKYAIKLAINTMNKHFIRYAFKCRQDKEYVG